jgi:hypothetical protein
VTAATSQNQNKREGMNGQEDSEQGPALLFFWFSAPE